MQRRKFMSAAAATAASLAAEALTFGRDWKDPVSVRYPDPEVVVVDPRFGKYKVGNAVIERLWTGCRWAEGPVWFGDGRSRKPHRRTFSATIISASFSVRRTALHLERGHKRVADRKHNSVLVNASAAAIVAAFFAEANRWTAIDVSSTRCRSTVHGAHSVR